jgi:hypothetical protein
VYTLHKYLIKAAAERKKKERKKVLILMAVYKSGVTLSLKIIGNLLCILLLILKGNSGGLGDTIFS